MIIEINNQKIEQFFINECKSDIKAFSEFILKNLQQNKNKKEFDSLNNVKEDNIFNNFSMKTPNQETSKALDELKAKKGQTFKSVDDLFDDLDN